MDQQIEDQVTKLVATMSPEQLARALVQERQQSSKLQRDNDAFLFDKNRADEVAKQSHAKKVDALRDEGDDAPDDDAKKHKHAAAKR